MLIQFFTNVNNYYYLYKEMIEISEKEDWIIKIKNEVPYVEIPERFREDSDIESMPLVDFMKIINQMKADETQKIDRGFMKHCCLKIKIKHCCVKPPPGTKYGAGNMSWCSNK